MMALNEAVATKAAASGTVGIAISFSLFNDVEFMTLFFVGVLSAFFSFFHDWTHTMGMEVNIKRFSELIKYLFYGVSMMFIVFYLTLHNINEYIELPKTAWGFVAAISSASAVDIIEWITPKLAAIVDKLFGRVK